MQLKTLSLPCPLFLNKHRSHFQRLYQPSLHFPPPPLSSQTNSPQKHCFQLKLTVTATARATDVNPHEIRDENGRNSHESNRHSIWAQMKEIGLFCGPATGLWICAPLMSLISTALVGRRSSTELAAFF